MKNKIGRLIGAVGVTLLWAQPSMAEQLNMGGSSLTSSFYPYYTTVAKSITATTPDLNVTVVSTGGFAKNAKLLLSGQINFGGVSPDLIQKEIDAGNDKLRVLWWATPSIQNIMVRKSAGVTDFRQLSDFCFHPGMSGSSTQRAMAAILKVLDVEPKLHLSDAADAINAIKDGRCDGQVKSISGSHLDAATSELNLSVPLFPVGYTKEEQQKIHAALPWIGFYNVAPNIVDGAPGYTTHALWIGFAATTDMSEQTAYNVMKGMWAGIDEERSVLKALGGVNVLQQTVDESGYLLHAGAVRFLRDQGITVPDKLVPPEMK